MPRLKDTRVVGRKYNELICDVLVYDQVEKRRKTICGVKVRYTVDYVILNIIKRKIGDDCVYLGHTIVSDEQYMAYLSLDKLIDAAEEIVHLGPAVAKVVIKPKREEKKQ